MGYSLFDFNGNEITFDQLDNKQFWCDHGEKQEIAFVKIYQKLKDEKRIDGTYSIQIHPNKEQDPYYPDLLVNGTMVGEAKIKNSPLFMARKYQVDPQYALTLDLKDTFNYHKRLREDQLDILIFIWVKWEAREMRTYQEIRLPNGQTDKKYYPNSTPVKPMGGIWCCPFSTLWEHIQTSQPHIHWYREHFRQSQLSNIESDWANELLQFEKRLQSNLSTVKNISSKGFHTPQGGTRTYPAGHSSGSYVLDLSNTEVFTEIFCSLNRK